MKKKLKMMFCAAFAAAFFAGCVAKVPVDTDANLVCRYGEWVIFSGRVRLTGEALDTGEGLPSSWWLCSDAGVVCRLELDERFEPGE